MNAVEIEEAVSELVSQPFDRAEFPYEFLRSFDNKEATIKKLRAGASNLSDIPGAVLQRNNIHIAVCDVGAVDETLRALRDNPKTTTAKAKFVLATDGDTIQAEDLTTGEVLVCEYEKLPDRFGFFLSLAGISTVKQIRESSFDIRATSRLNKLYVELLKSNPDWAKAERRHDMNHFMARLIFCFFAEDTDIFFGERAFTGKVEQMSASDASNTHEVIGEIFRAMDRKEVNRTPDNTPPYARQFPYVNGQLFSGNTDVPRFTKVARSYLINVGNLDWKKINPDIFGSMIQAVADEDERSVLGMHYTSVPNILKVLNPLFLDDLRAQFEEADGNTRKLSNLRNRMAHIRVFDPACGSGNFLVIAYKEMRALEAKINAARGEPDRKSEIPLTNFRGIELRDFPAAIARLALIIAEYQCDVLYRGQKEALAELLPLDSKNWITCGNALRLDWLTVFPPEGTGVKLRANDLFQTPLDQAEIDFENEGGETYICGNPPYLGSTWQSAEQKSDLKAIFDEKVSNWKLLDYVSGWFMKAADYGTHTNSAAALVSTNSVCQGQQVPILWPLIFATGHVIEFAHTSFKWANLASHNAGVTVVIVGISNHAGKTRKLYSFADGGKLIAKDAENINAYLVSGENVIVEPVRSAPPPRPDMIRGNTPYDGGNLLLSRDEVEQLQLNDDQKSRLIRRIYGSAEFINGLSRYCIWVEEKNLEEATAIETISNRFEKVRNVRAASPDAGARKMASTPHKFREMNFPKKHMIVTPRVSSENRPFLPVGLLDNHSVIGDRNFALYDAPLWNMALIASRLHWVWIGTVCVRMRTDFSYSNTLGWNTFPVPKLMRADMEALTKSAENILLAREAHFPATIADLYDPENMPENLRRAHDANDELLERIYIGRRFRNDTERLEKLFELYTKMAGQKTKIN